MDIEAPEIVERIMRVAEDVLGLRQRAETSKPPESG
jgi:hypothetical protein